MALCRVCNYPAVLWHRRCSAAAPDIKRPTRSPIAGRGLPKFSWNEKISKRLISIPKKPLVAMHMPAAELSSRFFNERGRQ
jgi:hypothetical protein